MSHPLILIIGYDPHILEFEAYLLKSEGYTVIKAYNIYEALDCIQTHSAALSLIITDFSMPEMDGDQFAVEVHKINPDLSILLACSNWSITKQDTDAWGIKSLIHKPYKKDQFIRLVSESI